MQRIYAGLTCNPKLLILNSRSFIYFMEKLRAGWDFIFSSYKRTAAVLFIGALLLAIPVTLSFLQQNQDIRQRAAGKEETPTPMRCGGFSAHAPVCPDGYSCLPDNPNVADEGGTCVIDTTPTPSPVSTSCVSCAAPPAGCSYSGASCATCGTLVCTSPTGSSQKTSVDLALSLTGIGTGAAGLNNNPKRPQRQVEVLVINSQGQQVSSISGAVNFDAASGIYKGSITLDSNVPTGSYIIKVRMDNTLWKQIPGIQTITAGETTETPVTKLTTGDINQDNVIDLLDYNLMISCLADKSTCTANSTN